MADDGASPPLVPQLASRLLPQPIVTLPTYTTADALSLFARLLEAVGYHDTRKALLQEAADRDVVLTNRAASLSEAGISFLLVRLPQSPTCSSPPRVAGKN